MPQYGYIMSKQCAGGEELPDGKGWVVSCVHLQEAQVRALRLRRWPAAYNSGILVAGELQSWRPLGIDASRDSWAIGDLVALAVDVEACKCQIRLSDPQLNPLLIGRIANLDEDKNVYFVLDDNVYAPYTGRGFVGSGVVRLPFDAVLWWAPIA